MENAAPAAPAAPVVPSGAADTSATAPKAGNTAAPKAMPRQPLKLTRMALEKLRKKYSSLM